MGHAYNYTTKFPEIIFFITAKLQANQYFFKNNIETNPRGKQCNFPRLHYYLFWIMHPTRQLGALSKRDHSYCAVCNSVVPQPISLSIAFGKHENRNTLSLMGFRPAEKTASKTRIMTEKCWLHQQGFFYTIKLLSLLLYNNICFIHKEYSTFSRKKCLLSSHADCQYSI